MSSEFGVHRCGAYPIFFFFNDTATTEIYTLSLHDALPISAMKALLVSTRFCWTLATRPRWRNFFETIRSLGSDRKSTRLNSSHSQISYAVFCLKKKNIYREIRRHAT